MQPKKTDQPAGGGNSKAELTVVDARALVEAAKTKYENYSQSDRAAALKTEFLTDDAFAKEKEEITQALEAITVLKTVDGRTMELLGLQEELEYVRDEILAPAEAEANAEKEKQKSSHVEPKDLNVGRGAVKNEPGEQQIE